MKYAAQTEVSIEKSQAEIKTIVMKYGATRYATMDDPECALIVFEIASRRIKFTLPLPNRDDYAHKRHSSGKLIPRSTEDAYAQWEQACRQRWRALCLIIKAKLEAVETGITTIEKEFLANILLPDGQLVGDYLAPQLELTYAAGTMPKMLPGIGETSPSN